MKKYLKLGCTIDGASNVKRVGFPPSHILNRLTGKDLCDDEHMKTNGLSSDERLLHDIVHLPLDDSKKPNGKNTGGKRCHSFKSTKKWKRLRYGGIDVCKQILYRHKKCDYARLLEHYCPLTADRNVDDEHKVREELGVGGGGGEGQPIDTIPKLVTSDCASDRVKSFISAVLNRVFPTEF